MFIEAFCRASCYDMASCILYVRICFQCVLCACLFFFVCSSSVHMEESSVMQGAQGVLVQNWPTASSAAGKNLSCYFHLSQSHLTYSEQWVRCSKKRNINKEVCLAHMDIVTSLLSKIVIAIYNLVNCIAVRHIPWHRFRQYQHKLFRHLYIPKELIKPQESNKMRTTEVSATRSPQPTPNPSRCCSERKWHMQRRRRWISLLSASGRETIQSKRGRERADSCLDDQIDVYRGISHWATEDKHSRTH